MLQILVLSTWLICAGDASNNVLKPSVSMPDVHRLVSTLRHAHDFNQRLRAVMSLIRLHDASALDDLNEALTDQAAMVRALTCLALSGYDMNQAAPLLQQAEHDPEAIVRRSARAARSDIVDLEHRRAALTGSGAENQRAETRVKRQSLRLDINRFVSTGSLPTQSMSMEQAVSEALDKNRIGLWAVPHIKTPAASYVLVGNAAWTTQNIDNGEKISLHVQGIVHKAPKNNLLGTIAANGAATLPNGVTPEQKEQALSQLMQNAADSAVGDIIDVINVDRKNNGETLLRN